MSNNKKFVAKNGIQSQNIHLVSNNESNTVIITIDDYGLVSVDGNIQFSNSIYDSLGNKGEVGQILNATANGILWQSNDSISGFSGTSGYSGISGYSGYSGSASAVVYDGGTPYTDFSVGFNLNAGGVV
jgi:hypothetical protein